MLSYLHFELLRLVRARPLRPSSWAAVVTQLVTLVFFSGMLPGGLSLTEQPLSVGGWPVLRVANSSSVCRTRWLVPNVREANQDQK